MKVEVEVTKVCYETVDIDDKFASLLEKFEKDDFNLTDREKELWDELIDLVNKNGWYAGYSFASNRKNTLWIL